VFRYAADNVGWKATDQVPAAELPESGRGRATCFQPIGYDQSQLRPAADPDTWDGREKSSSYDQRLEPIRKLNSSYLLHTVQHSLGQLNLATPPWVGAMSTTRTLRDALTVHIRDIAV